MLAMKNFLFLLLLLSPYWGFTQIKFEREIRIEHQDVEQTAKDFVCNLTSSKKVKWYKEFGFNSISIEAKTKFAGKRYSIEFTPEGQLEDVEIEVKMRDFPTETRENIKSYLKEKYGKYRIRKVQIQYAGEPAKVLKYLQEETRNKAVSIKYELIISSKVNKHFKKFEYLFTEAGAYLQNAEIVLKNTDNIEY